MRRTPVAILIAITALLAFHAAAVHGGGSERPSIDRSFAIVELKGEPLATYVRTWPRSGKRIDFDSAAVKTYRSQLASGRTAFASWLAANAPAAQIVGQFDIGLNAVEIQLNGTSLQTLRSAPQVLSAEYENLYYPQDSNDPDLTLIRAQEAWVTSQVGGTPNAGRGVKIVIIDSGIDITHPCFSDAGFPATLQLGDTRFTNNKVIAARVFAKSSDATAEAIQRHGTHVAGTAACNLDTPAAVNGVSIPYAVSGVAPGAQLGNYNVFPGTVEGARTGDIVDALETAYEDGFDVANVSLGIALSGKHDPLAKTVNNLDLANLVVTAAAGDGGPTRSSVTSPGSAARALDAGASSVPHFVGTPLSVGATTFLVRPGDFAVVLSDLTAPLGVVAGSIGGLADACSALAAGSLTGKIAVFSVGACTFSTQIRNAQNAGAVAAVVVNDVAGDPTHLLQDGTPIQPTIPTYMASRSSTPALVALNGQAGTIRAALSYFATGNGNIMARFSGQGPLDPRVKPDVVAPGVSVLNAVPTSFCSGAPCWAFLDGTSMASAHLAGAAAVLRGAHPIWSAAEVRSAIVNTASEGVLTNFSTGTTVVTDVNVVGTGLEDLLSAVQTAVAFDPVSVSFGSVKAGASQVRTASVMIKNLAAASQTFSLFLAPSTAGATFGVVPSVTLAGGQFATISLTLSVAAGSPSGDRQTILRVSRGGVEVAHVAAYASVK
jgi:minor extracellular serine protease Vpr